MVRTREASNALFPLMGCRLRLYELHRPSHFLRSSDPRVDAARAKEESAHNFELLSVLSHLEASYQRAVVALHFYRRARAESGGMRRISRDAMKEGISRRIDEDSVARAHEREIASELEAFKRELTDAGQYAGEEDWIIARKRDAIIRRFAERPDDQAEFPWPIQYLFSVSEMFAREFIFSLDEVEKLREKFVREVGAAGFSVHDVKLSTVVPDLKGARDSIHHVEDRARRKGRGEKEIKPHPRDADSSAELARPGRDPSPRSAKLAEGVDEPAISGAWEGDRAASGS